VADWGKIQKNSGKPARLKQKRRPAKRSYSLSSQWRKLSGESKSLLLPHSQKSLTLLFRAEHHGLLRRVVLYFAVIQFSSVLSMFMAWGVAQLHC